MTVTRPRPVLVGTRTPEVLRWTGFGGTVLLTAGAWAMSRTAAAGLAVAIAGTGLVVLAWALLGRNTPDATWLRRTLAVWCAPLLVVPPLFSKDVFSYLAQGEVAARGLDPNLVSPAAALTPDVVERVGVYWRDTPSPYGPLFGVIERTIAQVTTEPAVGVLLYRLVAVLGLLLVGWAVPRLAEIAGTSAHNALWLGVLNPLVLWHFIGGVHNDAVMLGLMLAGTVIALNAIDTKMWWQCAAGVVIIVLGAQVKLPALAALAIVGTALARRTGGGLIRFTLAGFGMLAAAVVVSAVTSLAAGLGVGWLRALGTPSTVNSWMAPTNWFGFATGGVGAVFGADITQAMIGAARVAGLVLILCGISLVVHRQWQGRISGVVALGMTMSLIVVLGPVVQPWYLLWAVLPLAAVVHGRWRVRVAATVAVFAMLVPPLAGDFSGRVGQLIAAYAIGIALVGAAYLALRRVSVAQA